MFSFMKWFEKNWQNLKSNKGLWFTILTISSLIGIFLSLYFVNYLVSDVAKKTYENQTKHYLLESKAVLDSFNEKLLAISTAISRDNSLQLLFQSDDENKTQKITAIGVDYSAKMNQILNTKAILVNFKYSNKDIDVKLKSGFDIEQDGLVLKTIMPLTTKDNIRLNLFVSEDISKLKEYYNKEKKKFAILLNRGASSKIENRLNKSDYMAVWDDYISNIKKFDKAFIQDIAKSDKKKLLKVGYKKDAKYFYIIKKIYDFNGQDIGYEIVGQNITEKNSFVNLIKNLVNSVTIVALGLIVSMILFLF